MITEIWGKFHTSSLEQVHGTNVGTNQNFKLKKGHYGKSQYS